MALVLPTGLSRPGGALLDSAPLVVGGSSASLIYVSSAVGSDSNHGRTRALPKATLAAAIAASSSGGVIHVAPDHEESFSSTAELQIGKPLFIFGEYSGTEPTAVINITGSGNSPWAMSSAGAGSWVSGIRFVCTNTNDCIGLDAPGATFEACRFEMSRTMDGGTCIELSGSGASDRLTFRDCVWVATDVAGVTTKPGACLDGLANGNDDFRFIGCTFDGGGVGFTASALDFSAASHSKVRIENVTLRRGADLDLSGANTGHVAGVTADGSCRVLTPAGTTVYPAGAGGTAAGTYLSTASPVYVLGTSAGATRQIWYVGPGGTDGASPAGLSRETPLGTLAQAFTNAANGDWVVVLAGSVLALSLLSVPTGVVVIGEGAAGSRSALQLGEAGAVTLDVAGSATELHGLALTGVSSGGGLDVAGGWFRLVDCDFSGSFGNGAQGQLFLDTGADQARVEGCTFADATPSVASLNLTDSSTFTSLHLLDCVVDRGTRGTAHLDLRSTTITSLVARLGLTNGAGCSVPAAFTGLVRVLPATDGGKVELT